MSRIQVLKLDDLNTLVIKKDKDENFFVTSSDSIIISVFNFSSLLKFMVFKRILSPKVLQEIVDEYYNAVKE